jgi:hypothetical protein
VKLIASTGLHSPMGEIVIVKTLEQGEMEIAGASRSHDQLRVIGQLQQCGAALVLLDGALGRSAHASPAIADSVILATGAALGGGMMDVLRKTRDRLSILGIAQADETMRSLCAPVFRDGGVGLWSAQGVPLFQAQVATLNAGATLLQYLGADVATIALSGAVGRRVWQALMTLAAAHPGLTVVVADGAKLFVENTDLMAFNKLGARVLSRQAIHIAGITLNPFSPLGGSFEAEDFLAAAREKFSGYVVSDVVWEEMHPHPDPLPHAGEGAKTTQGN